MISEQPRSKPTFSNDFNKLQEQYHNSSIMDPQRRMNRSSYVEVRKYDYRRRSLSQGHGKMMFRYFTSESLFLLACLMASLLILPLVLPPLPPPPLMLLLVPIFILALLMVLAFMPFRVRDVSHAYT